MVGCRAVKGFGYEPTGDKLSRVGCVSGAALIDPKLVNAFPTYEALDEALRGPLDLADETARIICRAEKPAQT